MSKGQQFLPGDGWGARVCLRLAAAALLLAPCARAQTEPVTLSVTVDGVKRTALVYPGTDAATTPSPVVLSFHGMGGSASGLTGGFHTAWPEATVVYPQALTSEAWPFTSSPRITTRWSKREGDQDNRDIRFIDALLVKLAESYRVDPRRIYAAGHSGGAIFVWALLIRLPEPFAAFASVSSAAGEGLDWPLRWARVPRPILIMYGTADTSAPILEAEYGREMACRLNGLDGATDSWMTGYLRYTSATGNPPVIWRKHSGGHAWPGDATRGIVRFFQEQAFPEPATPAPEDSSLPREPGEAGVTAGSGEPGSGWREEWTGGIPALAVRLSDPEAVAVAVDGALLLADTNNYRIRRVDTDGRAASIAGTTWVHEGSTARNCFVLSGTSIVPDTDGAYYYVDTGYARVRRVSPDGSLTTIAGTGSTSAVGPRFGGFTGDGGPGARAQLRWPSGLTLDATGNLYIADSGNHRIRRVSPDGKIATVAGSGPTGIGNGGFGGDSGPATEALLDFPDSVAVDTSGHLFLSDTNNHRIRRVDAATGVITTVAGTGEPGFSGDGGPATAAMLRYPEGIAVDTEGSLFVADPYNHRVRKVAVDGTISTVAGGGDAPVAANGIPLWYPVGVAIDREGSLYIADSGDHRVRKVAGAAAPGLLAGKPFPPAVMRGDLTGDGKVGVADATLALRCAVGLLSPSAKQLEAGDLDGSGAITLADVIRLLRIALGMQG